MDASPAAGAWPPRVGIVGAGQLARMTYQAAIGLGVRVAVLADDPRDSAALVAAEATVDSSRDPRAVASFAAGCDVLTFDHELVHPDALAELEHAGHVLRPRASAKRFAQDKAHQRTAFGAGGLPIPPFSLVEGAGDVDAFAEQHGWPVVLKAARGGYDGRGVWVVGSTAEAAKVLAGGSSTSFLVEAFVAIERELAVLVARRPSGGTVVYPLAETVQASGICRELAVPAAVPDAVAAEAAALAVRVAALTDATGILAVELFATPGGLVVNELACRPHNSGHWTIEGAATSQFANHVRGVLDWPLGSVELRAPVVATVNVLGPADGSEPFRAVPEVLALPDVHVHWYGKAARPGRKLGHVTALGDDRVETQERARHAAALLGQGAW